MSDQFVMFGEMTSEGTGNVISSPGLESGVTRSDLPDGEMTQKSGPAPAPAPRSAQQAKAEGLMTLVISGRSGTDSSASAALQSCLESRLMQRLDMAGSTLFKLTWKRKVTPLGRPYLVRAASAHRTEGKGCTSSVPTPNGDDANNGTQDSGQFQSLTRTARFAAVPTPQTHDITTRGNTEADNHYYPHDLSNVVQLVTVSTPRANDAEKRGQPAAEERNGLVGNAMLATVATPRSEDSQCAGAHRGTPDTLHAQANLALVTTPSARDWKDTTGMSETGTDPDGSTRSRIDQLLRQEQLAASGPTVTGGTGATASTGQLNPAYSRWLMGLPAVWDDCAVTAMQSFRKSRKRSSDHSWRCEMDSISGLQADGVWKVTDGTDAVLPVNEGAVRAGNPLVMAFNPGKGYRDMYAYRSVPVAARNRGVVKFWAEVRFQDFAGIMGCQQFEFDAFNMYFQGQRHNGGLAARFVGPHSGEWHVFDVAGQKWVETGIAVPLEPQWVAGVRVEADYYLSPGKTEFLGMKVNGQQSLIGQMMGTQAKSATDGVFTAVQLDSKSLPGQQVVLVDELGLSFD